MSQIPPLQATITPIPPSHFSGKVRHGPHKWLVLSESNFPQVWMTVLYASITLDATAETWGRKFHLERRYIQRVEAQVTRRRLGGRFGHDESETPCCHLTIHHTEPDTPRFLQFVYGGFNIAGLTEALVSANYMAPDRAEEVIAAMDSS